jgi:hypothetical protein
MYYLEILTPLDTSKYNNGKQKRGEKRTTLKSFKQAISILFNADTHAYRMGTCVVSYTPFDADCFKYNAYVFTKSQINPFLNIYVCVLCYLRTILNNNNNKTFILKIGKCCTQMNVNTYNTQTDICINDILFSYNQFKIQEQRQ